MRRELRRRAVRDAAAVEFAETGYDMATLDDIGKRLGLSKAGLYYYVEGKEDLLIDLAEEAVTQVENALDGLPPETTATEKLSAFVSAHIQMAFNSAIGRVLTQNLERLFSITGARPVWERYERFVQDILRSGAESGEFVDVDPLIVTRMLLAAMNATPRWFDPDGHMSADHLVELTINTLLRGIQRGAPGE